MFYHKLMYSLWVFKNKNKYCAPVAFYTLRQSSLNKTEEPFSH